MREHDAEDIAENELVTTRAPTGSTPYSILYRVAAMIRVDSGAPSHKLPRRRRYFFAVLFLTCSLLVLAPWKVIYSLRCALATDTRAALVKGAPRCCCGLLLVTAVL